MRIYVHIFVDPVKCCVITYVGRKPCCRNDRYYYCLGSCSVLSNEAIYLYRTDICTIRRHGGYQATFMFKVFIAVSVLESKLETTFQTPSTGLRHPSWRCRKAMLGVWLHLCAVSLLQFGCLKVNLKLHLCSVSLLQFRCLKVNLKLHLCSVSLLQFRCLKVNLMTKFIVS